MFKCYPILYYSSYDKKSLKNKIEEMKSLLVEEINKRDKRVNIIKFPLLIEFCCLHPYMAQTQKQNILERKDFVIFNPFIDTSFSFSEKEKIKISEKSEHIVYNFKNWKIILEHSYDSTSLYPNKILLQNSNLNTKLSVVSEIEFFEAFPQRNLIFPYFFILFNTDHFSKPLLFFSHKKATLFLYDKNLKSINVIPFYTSKKSKEEDIFNSIKEFLSLQKIVIEINNLISSISKIKIFYIKKDSEVNNLEKNLIKLYKLNLTLDKNSYDYNFNNKFFNF